MIQRTKTNPVWCETLSGVKWSQVKQCWRWSVYLCGLCVCRVNSPQPATCGLSGSRCGRCWASVKSSRTPTWQMSKLLTTPGSSSETRADRYAHKLLNSVNVTKKPTSFTRLDTLKINFSVGINTLVLFLRWLRALLHLPCLGLDCLPFFFIVVHTKPFRCERGLGLKKRCKRVSFIK